MRIGLFLLLIVIFTVPAAAQSVCPLSSQLHPNEMGEVRYTDGNPLNVRDRAGRAGQVVGAFDEGTRFTVAGDATCTDCINWWPVQTEAISGWIAEGADDI